MHEPATAAGVNSAFHEQRQFKAGGRQDQHRAAACTCTDTASPSSAGKLTSLTDEAPFVRNALVASGLSIALG
jgi:hypothetical protein